MSQRVRHDGAQHILVLGRAEFHLFFLLSCNWLCHFIKHFEHVYSSMAGTLHNALGDTQSCPHGSQSLVRGWMRPQPSRTQSVEGQVVSTGQDRAEQRGLSHRRWGTPGKWVDLDRLAGESGVGRSSNCYLQDTKGSPHCEGTAGRPAGRRQLREAGELGGVQLWMFPVVWMVFSQMDNVFIHLAIAVLLL